MINKNSLAIAVADAEGGKKSVSIGQIKEVIRHTFRYLQDYSGSEILKVIEDQK